MKKDYTDFKTGDRFRVIANRREERVVLEYIIQNIDETGKITFKCVNSEESAVVCKRGNICLGNGVGIRNLGTRGRGYRAHVEISVSGGYYYKHEKVRERKS